MGPRSRQRFKAYQRTQLAPNDVWNTPINVGYFESKIRGIDNGIPFERWSGIYYDRFFFTPAEEHSFVEITVDELHDGPPFRSGGPFLNVKYHNDEASNSEQVINSGVYLNCDQTRRFVGGFMHPNRASWGGGWASEDPHLLATLGSSFSDSYLPDVAPYFDRAWASAKPKIQFANLYTFLKEFGDIPRMLKSTSEGFHRSWRALGGDAGPLMKPGFVADQFLNQQFGWLPFLSDLRDFYRVYKDANKLMAQIRDQNNKWVRRKVRVFKDVESEYIVPAGTVGCPMFPVSFPRDFLTGNPTYSIWEDRKTTLSASGKFRFYRPEFDEGLPDYSSAWKQAMRYVTISGLRPTPSNIYKGIPWTWLADWVSNVGARLERFSDDIIDSVAAEYFYITCHKEITRTMSCILPLCSGTINLTLTKSISTKQRVSADSPYGFRLTWDNLTPKKLAILGALGITRRQTP
jgi:hypothetical protein